MKIIADLQACQSIPHRDRGIGRYARTLASNMQQLLGAQSCMLGLNSAIPGTIEPVRAALPPETRIFTWEGLRHIEAINPAKRGSRDAANLLREEAFRAHAPAMVHVGSLFEGYFDDVVVDIPVSAAAPVAVTLYDLIPLIHQDVYLKDDAFRAWYLSRTQLLKRADLILAISESTKREAIEYLGIPEHRVVSISSAADPMFQRLEIGAEARDALLHRYALDGRFLLYTGGIDPRKNIDRLIEAFGRVHAQVDPHVQLLIVCSITRESEAALRNRARLAGLPDRSLIFAGFVSDQDLVSLYNLCEGFVFPSWHEGFGLPVLEAMSCGAPAIAADRTSLPEVVGRPDALFDPFSIEDMTRSLSQLVADSQFRRQLSAHGLERSREFSWKRTAGLAIAAMREVCEPRSGGRPTATNHASVKQPTLAFLSPLPPERSGIASYSSQLLPRLAEHYRITLIVDQPSVVPEEGWQTLPVRDVPWFRDNAAGFDRILFQFGNSPFHCHMFDLLEQHGGVVVLHDYFLSGVVSHMEWASKAPGFWTKYLYLSHGYPALLDRNSGMHPEDMLLRYPCNGPVIEHADGVIVHSQHARALSEDHYAGGTGDDWHIVPLLRPMPANLDRGSARAALGIQPDEFVVCSFGILGPGKLNDRLIEAWLASDLASDDKARLVFVGEAHDPAYAAMLEGMVEASGTATSVNITGYVDSDTYARYLQAADVAVQLRKDSRGETSAAALDAMSHGLPTVVNAHGSMSELEGCLKVEEAADHVALATVLERLRASDELRAGLRREALEFCRTTLDPVTVAGHYRYAIEKSYAGSNAEAARRLGRMLGSTWESLPAEVRADTCEALVVNARRPRTSRQLLVDVTELVRRDARSGIQRVVRSVVTALLKMSIHGYRVEPVYADGTGGYRYARRFTFDFLGLGESPLDDELVSERVGDVFLGLDLALEEIPEELARLRRMRDHGVRIHVVVYDVLPLRRNDCFPPRAEVLYRRWLSSVVDVADGVMCISRAVADELIEELDGLEVARERPLSIAYFHLGADLDASNPTAGISASERGALEEIDRTRSFLMVGTVEPRKGHVQAIDAFEHLWESGHDFQLVVVGKQGWMTSELGDRIRGHEEFGRRLVWFDRASDELLEGLYRRCAALLVPSEGEGFGLPLIEAAKRGLPILARDLAVFREVAGAGATYFGGYEAEQLADAVVRWRKAFHEGTAASPDAVSWLTWEESAADLVRLILENEGQMHWHPGQRRYQPSHDTRNQAGSGGRVRGMIVMPSSPDMVMRARPMDLPGGQYVVRVEGRCWKAGSLRLVIETQEGCELVCVTAPVHEDPAPSLLLEAPLVLEKAMAGLQATVWSDGEARGHLQGLVWMSRNAGAPLDAYNGDGT